MTSNWRARWPLCFRSTLDEMRLRLTASHDARVQAEEIAANVTMELRKARLLIAEQAERLRGAHGGLGA